MEIIRLKNVTKEYDNGDLKLKAINNISLSINKGEFIMIVGASGSGKTTLLNLIGGLLKPDSGTIFIDDINLCKAKSDDLARFRRRHVGFVYQSFNLLPMLNVKENILLPIKLDHRTVDMNVFNKLCSYLKLSNKLSFMPPNLSFGEEQKVTIARALINNPSILLADEPTGNLDSNQTERVLKIFRDTNKELNQTIIMSTHNLYLTKYADRVLMLEDGKIVKEIK